MADLILGGDAGHALTTPGKETPDKEKEWSFNDVVIKAFIKEINTYEGVKFNRYDDPTGKKDIALSTRTNNANKDKCDYYFSFHHNANTGKWGTWTGSETHVYEKLSDSSETMKVAKLLNAAQVSGMGLRDRGIKKTNLHITRETSMPAFLFEGGFMDSTIDIKKMRDIGTLQKTGKAIAVAFAKYKKLKKKSGGGGDTGTQGTVTVLVNGLWYYDKADWNAKLGQANKGEVFTVVDKLKVDGSDMYKLKSGTYITAWHEYVEFKKK